jgi:hypothetical protein
LYALHPELLRYATVNTAAVAMGGADHERGAGPGWRATAAQRVAFIRRPGAIERSGLSGGIETGGRFVGRLLAKNDRTRRGDPEHNHAGPSSTMSLRAGIIQKPGDIVTMVGDGGITAIFRKSEH